MIRELKNTYKVTELCSLLGVSTSGYYTWTRGGRGKRSQANIELGERIKQIHQRSRSTYGSPRITRELHAQGIRCGHNRVARIMRSMGLKGIQRGHFQPKATDGGPTVRAFPNRLRELPKPTRANEVWVCDITYIPIRAHWGYLAAIMDLTTRQVRAWTLSDSLNASLVVESFERAVARHRPAPGLIVHSDRGAQYASSLFREQLANVDAVGSMSRTGNCYDNAAMESFWATLKTEARIRKPFNSTKQANLALFDYIETFYNTQRSHSSIGYMSPNQYEAQLKK